MGGALAEAVCASIAPGRVTVNDVSGERMKKLAGMLGCRWGSAEEVVAGSKYIFLGVKPQVLRDTLAGMLPALKEKGERFVLVSMAAGVGMASVRAYAGADYPVIRIMPNTPVAVGKGLVMYDCAGVTENEERDFVEFMSGAGKLDRLPEELIDAGCALSGCGPAFVYTFIEALAEGAVKCGLPGDKALDYAIRTVNGASELALRSGKGPGTLRDEVCSPGGSTIEGVRVLDASGFEDDIAATVKASYDRTRELGGK